MGYRTFFILSFIILFGVNIHSQPAFNAKIYIPSNLEKNVVLSVEDMAYWLGKATGKQFSIQETSARKADGIQLLRVVHSDLSRKDINQLEIDGQSSYLKIKGQSSAQIIGTGSNSLINGIYTFLHELGFRWYMPGEVWTKVPGKEQLGKHIDKIFSPSFQNRGYFGTGGIGPVPGLDDKNTFKKDFDDWNRRNRLSAEFTSKGHTGQVFYKESKNILDQNPSFSCNGLINTRGRLNISNPTAVNLFVDWAIKKIDYSESIPMVSVDPADGSGGKDDCLPKNMKGINNFSDKYFWLANKVAEKITEKRIDGYVQMLAYASHAAPPSFEIHPRVYPIIIPYAFQRETDPVSFIKLWSKKTNGRPMGIYDYWNITQWSKGEPQFNIYDIPKKLQLWKQFNINFIRIESTNAKGPMGHAWWLAAQMMWDVDQSFDDLYKEFLENNFGTAASDIKNMYDRWSLNYQAAMDVSFTMNDLENATGKTKDQKIIKRINELKAYAVFLEKYHTYNSNSTLPLYTDLIQYINSIHHLRLLQTRPLQVLYIKPPAGYTKKNVEKKVEITNTEVNALNDNEIEKEFSQAFKRTPVSYKISNFQFDIKKTKASSSTGKKHYHPMYIHGPFNYSFYIPQKRKINIQVGATNPIQFTIKEESDKALLQGNIEGSKSAYEKFEVELSPGIYNLQIGELYRFTRFIFPTDIPLFTSNTIYDNFGYPLQYVYVPKGVDEIVYHDAIGPNKNKRGFWIDPDGKNKMPEKLKFNTYKVKVPPHQQGKLWVLNIGHRNYELLNLPNIFSLNEFEYKE